MLLTCASVIGFSSKDFFLKKLFLGPGRSKSRDFGIMAHDPLYFEVGIFRDQRTPPYV